MLKVILKLKKKIIFCVKMLLIGHDWSIDILTWLVGLSGQTQQKKL